MKNLICLALLFLCFRLTAQHSYIYEFANTLDETSGQGPTLTPLGEKGTFVQESLPELGGVQRTVYKFSKNCGLNYNMNTSKLNLRGSYTIEIYFKFDLLNSWKRVIDFKNRATDNGAYIFNGKLNFYNIITSDISPVAAGEYTHYTFVYDAASNTVNIYADGIGKISFKDTQGDAQIDPNELHFFYDDLKVNNEASSGTVAYIKLFDYAVTPQEAKKNFDNLQTTIQSTKITPVIAQKTQLALTILNTTTTQPVPSTITITNKQSGAVVTTLQSTGNSTIDLAGGTYMINVNANGFAKTTQEVTITTGIISKEIKLTPIKVGQSIKLENVHFKQGLPELLPEAYPVLDSLVIMLKENTTMEIELSGYTDNVGDPKLNLKLSQDRVKVIETYIESKGISDKRVSGKGYGGANPIASNDKEETRKLNRRVEFKVTKF